MVVSGLFDNTSLVFELDLGYAICQLTEGCESASRKYIEEQMKI